MKMNKENIFLKLTKYRFEFRHLTLLFGILIGFQILISLVQKTSLQNFLLKTQDWYQKDSAERMANLTATSLELLLYALMILRSSGSFLRMRKQTRVLRNAAARRFL
ncbi:MAG TPA: hypothetical protein VHO28_15475, partial [Ignavibacteriales bacterium]|nr:hypothetical protein [Ignavibacteriales bacterium]